MENNDEVPVPPQWEAQTLYDFRGMADGPKGYKVGITMYGSNKGSKRKLEEYADQVGMTFSVAPPLGILNAARACHL